MRKLISVIIPTHNEEKVIGDCLESLKKQNYKPLELIVVDDGSQDKTVDIVKKYRITILRQNHRGPGPARNLGSKHAKGEILVFVDADMIFDRNFISDLVRPILDNRTIGTFSKNEMVANTNNLWSICWNINRNLPESRMIPLDYPNEAPVFRAILKKEFDKVGGFEATGEYTDDWSLSRKLGIKSTLASGAFYYHANPSSISEVWRQARWIGKNEFISGSLKRRVRSLIFYSLPVSLGIGVFKSIINGQLAFIVFKFIYDLAIFVSVLKSFAKEQKAK